MNQTVGNPMHSIAVLPDDMDGGTLHDDATCASQARIDAGAFEAIYQRYLDRIYAYLRARTENNDDASDLAQQVFLQAFAALPKFRGQDDQLTAWLFRIARNTALNFNQRRRHTVTWDFVPEALLPRDERSVHAALVRREALAPLRALVRAQPAAIQELLLLRFVAQLTIAEIATVIGKSEAATSKRLSRTIQRLQEHYDDYDR